MTPPGDRFTAEEWSVLVGAPLLAAMAEMGRGRGALRATLAVTQAYGDARDAYRTPLLNALLATPPATAVKRPRRRKTLGRDAAAAQAAATDILDRLATAEERAEYRHLVTALVTAAAAAA